MKVGVKNIATTYSANDHATWAALFARQKTTIKDIACKEFLRGSKKLALDPKHIPDVRQTSARISTLTGWKLLNAKNKSLSMKDWFASMNKRSFPVTDYIRKPENFDYTAMPDLFHEYFGHLPFFTDKAFAEMAHRFGALCAKANKRQLLQLSRIWSLGVEFGLVKERGAIKFFGAGLLSSYGESLHARAMIKKGKILPFNLPDVIKTPGRTYQYHQKYFVLNKTKDVLGFLNEYAEKEGLRV